jgi:hypothetical protein
MPEAPAQSECGGHDATPRSAHWSCGAPPRFVPRSLIYESINCRHVLERLALFWNSLA